MILYNKNEDKYMIKIETKDNYERDIIARIINNKYEIDNTNANRLEIILSSSEFKNLIEFNEN